MSGKVVFHIGTHKTGTTTIQEFLRQNKPGLLERGVARVVDDVLLTKTGEQRAAHRIAEALSLAERSPDWETLTAGVAAAPRDLPLVVSSERIFRYLAAAKTPERRARVTDALRTVFGDDATFVLYVRNFGDYFNSLVSERIIATTEARPVAEIVASLFHLAEISAVTAHLRAVFGAGSVRLHAFDAAARGEGGLLGQFARSMGWAADGLVFPEARLHAMPPANVLAMKYRINGRGVDATLYPILRRQISKITALHRGGGPFRLIDDALVDRIVAECRARNPELETLDPGVLFSDKVKAKPYVNLDAPQDEPLFDSLLEFYQLSALGDAKRVRLFG